MVVGDCCANEPVRRAEKSISQQTLEIDGELATAQFVVSRYSEDCKECPAPKIGLRVTRMGKNILSFETDGVAVDDQTTSVELDGNPPKEIILVVQRGSSMGVRPHVFRHDKDRGFEKLEFNDGGFAPDAIGIRDISGDGTFEIIYKYVTTAHVIAGGLPDIFEYRDGELRIANKLHREFLAGMKGFSKMPASVLDKNRPVASGIVWGLALAEKSVALGDWETHSQQIESLRQAILTEYSDDADRLQQQFYLRAIFFGAARTAAAFEAPNEVEKFILHSWGHNPEETEIDNETFLEARAVATALCKSFGYDPVFDIVLEE